MSCVQGGSFGFCRVSNAMLVGPLDESNNGRVIGGERNDDHERRKKRDQAAAISTGHHAAVRQVVHRLPVESAQSRRDDARARPVRRSFHDSPLDRQAGSGWRKPFGNGSANEASARSAKAGDWTRRTSRSAARTGIGIARLISKETPSTSC